MQSEKFHLCIVSSTGVLKETVGLCKAGASVRETCIHADKRIEEETGKAFKKDKNLQKGKTISSMLPLPPFSIQDTNDMLNSSFI